MTVVKNIKKNAFFFSDHASQQLHARTSMKRTDVLRMLADEICIPVGTDNHRIHTIIYSVKDSLPLIIVHDERNGEIITILYTDYNNKFVIAPSIEKEIKELTFSRFYRHKEPIEFQTSWIDLFTTLRKCPPVKNFLTLSFIVNDGQYEKEVEFLKIPVNDFDCDVNKVRDMDNIKLRIDKARNRLNIKINHVSKIVAHTDTGRLIVLGTSKLYINPPNPKNNKNNSLQADQSLV